MQLVEGKSYTRTIYCSPERICKIEFVFVNFAELCRINVLYEKKYSQGLIYLGSEKASYTLDEFSALLRDSYEYQIQIDRMQNDIQYKENSIENLKNKNKELQEKLRLAGEEIERKFCK